MIALRCGEAAAEIAPQGAELRRWSCFGREWLWSGDPAWWNRVSPLLFPIVGALRGGTFTHGGQSYALPRHGFARDLPWTPVEHTAEAVRLRLVDTESTRAVYPFPFQLDVGYRLGPDSLHLQATLTNPGSEDLPASFGLHPAFRWPLDPAFPKDAHHVRFEHPEPGPLRRLEGDLLGGTAPSPVEGRDLPLSDDLFSQDALVWEGPRSRSLVYGVPGGPALRLAWDLPQLALWSKPGAPFLCLEPWQGHADPEDFDGPLLDKPGVVRVPPGETRVWSCLIQALLPSDTLST